MDGGSTTREVDMKNALFIIILCFIQSACSTTVMQPANSGTLLGFADLANEITVNRVEPAPVKAVDSDVDGTIGTP